MQSPRRFVWIELGRFRDEIKDKFLFDVLIVIYGEAGMLGNQGPRIVANAGESIGIYALVLIMRLHGISPLANAELRS